MKKTPQLKLPSLPRELSLNDEEVHYPLMQHTYLTAEQVALFRAAARKLGWSVSAFLRNSAEQAAQKLMEVP